MVAERCEEPVADRMKMSFGCVAIVVIEYESLGANGRTLHGHPGAAGDEEDGIACQLQVGEEMRRRPFAIDESCFARCIAGLPSLTGTRKAAINCSPVATLGRGIDPTFAGTGTVSTRNSPAASVTGICGPPKASRFPM